MTNRILSLAIFSALILACGGDSTGPQAGPPKNVRAYTTRTISGAINAPVDPPPAVIVTDHWGIPKAGVRVQFEVESGAGTVTPEYAVSGPDGVARADEWILGPYASYTSSGRSSPNVLSAFEPLSGSRVTFTASAKAGPPAKAVPSLSPGSTLIAGFPVTITLEVLDSSYNFLPNVPVSFSVTAGGGAIDTATVMTNVIGKVSVQWMLGTPGANVALATIKGGPTATITETALDPTMYTWYDLQMSGVCATSLRASMIGLAQTDQLVTLDEYAPDEETDPLYISFGHYAIVGDSVRLSTNTLNKTGSFQNDRITLQVEDCGGATADWIYLKRSR